MTWKPATISAISVVDGIVVVEHGGDENYSRPPAPMVYWKGTNPPANASSGDFYFEIDQSGDVLSVNVFYGEQGFSGTVGSPEDIGAVPTTRTITAGDGLSGGGDLSDNRSIDVDSTVVRTTRTITAGDGLSGGGDLSDNRSIDVDSTVVRSSGNQSLGGTLSAQHINPSTTNTYDLGTTSLRWRNIYTQDLHLSNGIGDYTVVEGEEDLFIVNNITGKSFKFALIEVSPEQVPGRSEQQ